MARRLRPVAAAAVLAGLVAVAGVGAAASGDPKGSLSCVQPLDAAGIDSVLAQAGSPLAGEGGTLVHAGASWGIDPRALVAIAAHESILLTYPPALAIHNPFGIGPGRGFATTGDAITYAAELLARNYVGEGRRTLADIAGKWAPLGAANDPAGLNASWAAGVSAAYARLGGNPAVPITLGSQTGTSCQAPPSQATAGPVAAGVVTWNGSAPSVDEPRMDRGADPATGAPATLDGFVFPVVPGPTPIAYRDDFAEPGAPGCYGRAIRCAVTLTTEPGAVVVAATAGVLAAASPEEQAGGIAFWIVATGGDRVGYGGLAAYAPGIADGAAVAAGQALGSSTRTTAFAWERSGQRINAFPLLSATLPSQG